ncbi:MAG: PhzF family phenazine biosynthesis protein [Bacteroidales bacterium]|nr:PhzF family phenazine biosynthesis protein [Bacteroidales bacterium]
MKYYIVDAFTDKPFGGNPAGVVLLEGNTYPDENLMLKIAAEFRYSETAFVQQNGRDEFTIRYFTPCSEVELCGHATIASFFVLKHMGLPDGQYRGHTNAGLLSIVVGEKVMMQMAKPRIVATLGAEDIEEVYRSVGANPTEIHPQVVYSGLPDIMLPIATLAELQSLQPDMEAVTAVTRRLDAVSVHAFVCSGDEYTAHVRDFAPLYGVPEESATGTANAALTYYLVQNGFVGAPAECRFLQGEAMGRPSVVATRMESEATIYVGGTAAIVAEGTLSPRLI